MNISLKNALIGLGLTGAAAVSITMNVQNYKTSKQNLKELEGLRIENRALAADTLEKSLHIKELKSNILNEQENFARTMYPKQLDSLKKISPKKLCWDFYERLINNASLLDSIENRSLRMDREVIPNIPDTIPEDIYQVGRYSSKAARNLIHHFHKAI